MYTRRLSTFVRSKVRFCSNKCSYIDISEEVRHALNNNLPILALESTIISHGMPKPHNIDCAISVEEIVRKEGVVPATVAIIRGRIKVGVSHESLRQLTDPPVGIDVVKTSRRDLPYVVGNKRAHGGTTVSGTVVVCARAGLPLFATGGIGGVHRDGQNTMDISADLVELGRNNVGVVCAGVKSILDVGRTLEYLETLGVCVTTYGRDKSFPAFYTQNSGYKSAYNVQTPQQAARMIHSALELNLKSGLLFAVPVPEEHALSHASIESAIEMGLREAHKHRIKGKDITPYLLQFIAQLTEGKSLDTNIALVRNNAKIGAQIAASLAQLRTHPKPTRCATQTNRPVIIGGSVLDRHAALTTDAELTLDGRVHNVQTFDSPGGVARNICDALIKISNNLSNGHAPIFLTAVGDDDAARILRSSVAPCTDYIRDVTGASSAQCTVVLDTHGDCKLLLGDMGVHQMITPQMVAELEDVIKEAPIMVLDGNLSLETMDCCLELATKHKISVLYEPTDQPLATKPFESSLYWPAINYITPNLTELKMIAVHFGFTGDLAKSSTILQQAVAYGKIVSQFINTVVVTLAGEGVLIFRRNTADNPMNRFLTSGSIEIRHYPVPYVVSIINVSGAGDCFTAGVIYGLLQNKSEKECISLGFNAANVALKSKNAVPQEMSVSYNKLAKYITI